MKTPTHIVLEETATYVDVLFSGSHRARISPEDKERVLALNWHILKTPTSSYLCRNVMTPKGPRKQLLHTFILNTPAKLWTDHINGDTSNYTRANLRVVTPSQNNQNRSKSKNTSSKYMGVCFYKSLSKWVANVRYNGKRFYLGYFSDEKEAAEARDNFCKSLTGSTFKYNFNN